MCLASVSSAFTLSIFLYYRKLSICFSVQLTIYLSIYISKWLTLPMRNKLFVSVCLSFCLSILFVYLSIKGNISKEESITCLRMLYIFIYIYLPAGPRFLLHVYLLFSHVSFINTFKHVKDALYVFLWFLYCLGFLSIEQILFVTYLSGLYQ